MTGDRREILAGLRARVARLERGTGLGVSLGAAPGAGSGPAAARDCLPFGIARLDARLPGGGLRRAALHEIAPAGASLADAAASALFVAGILARLSGPVLWCASARDLFAPGLAGAGLHPDRVFHAEILREADLLPLVEEGARFRGLAAVVGEVAGTGLTATRRLQLAAEDSGVTVFLLGRPRTSRKLAGAAEEAFVPARSSAAATRWAVGVAPSAPIPLPLSVPGLGRARWQVALLRCRGAPAGTEACRWLLEACDEAGRLALPADLADGPGAAAPSRRAVAG